MIQSYATPIILVIEDDLGLTELIREEIGLRGWNFLHAATGREALAILAEERPDLVILDYTLPDMTALQLLEQADLPPFIVTTGSGDERIAVTMMKQGARDYLVKDAHFLAALPGAVDRALHGLDVERQLAEAQAQLKARDEALRNAQKLESLGRMAGGIAHDFNNLFQAIQGNLEVACLSAPAETRHAVERALTVLEKASALAHQMLNVSGKSFRRSETVDLNRLVRDCLGAYRAVPGAAGIQIEDGEALPPVELDPDQVGQVLAGLVANAQEALPTGSGPIRVSTRLLSPWRIETDGGHWVNPPANALEAVCLSIEDDGPGMTREVLDKAFDPFFSTHRPGRGLGLSAALGILKGHGAGLWIRTAPGQGTTIRMLFPPSPAGLPETAHPVVPEATVNRRTLLLVDDDEDLQETLGEFLTVNLGYRILQARDGLEAVDLYRQEQDRIGLILMDATMPRMTGPDAFRIIRELDPSAKAILCSGFSEAAGTKVALAFGFTEFLKKPFSLRTFQATIERQLGPPAT
jgi:signal transduction histidine kinase